MFRSWHKPFSLHPRTLMLLSKFQIHRKSMRCPSAWRSHKRSSSTSDRCRRSRRTTSLANHTFTSDRHWLHGRNSCFWQGVWSSPYQRHFDTQHLLQSPLEVQAVPLHGSRNQWRTQLGRWAHNPRKTPGPFPFSRDTKCL